MIAKFGTMDIEIKNRYYTGITTVCKHHYLQWWSMGQTEYTYPLLWSIFCPSVISILWHSGKGMVILSMMTQCKCYQCQQRLRHYHNHLVIFTLTCTGNDAIISKDGNTLIITFKVWLWKGHLVQMIWTPRMKD